MKADNLLNGFYDKVAQQICDEVCCDNCKHKNLCHYNTATRRSDSEDVNTMFFSMLDNVEKVLNKTPDNNATTSYSEYYSDTAVIDWDRLLDKIKSALVKSVEACKGEDNSRIKMIAKAKKLLMAKVSPVSIASVYYYKDNHRLYNKPLFTAFSKVVAEYIGDGKNPLTRILSKSLEKHIRHLTQLAAREVYSELYVKPHIKSDQRPSEEEFESCINAADSPILAVQTTLSQQHSHRHC